MNASVLALTASHPAANCHLLLAFQPSSSHRSKTSSSVAATAGGVADTSVNYCLTASDQQQRSNPPLTPPACSLLFDKQPDP